MSDTYSYDIASQSWVGNRISNMFSVQSLSGGQPLWLPNPEKDSAKGLIATLVDTARNTKGVVTAQKICRDQDKIELQWKFLSKLEWENLVAFFNSNFEFNLTYYSPVAHKKISRVFYVGDRSYRPFDITSEGVPTAYVDCVANVIDTGLTL